MSFFRICLEAALIALALSVDSFVAAFSYGTSKIKIPFSSVGIISVTSSLITGLSMLTGSFVKDYIPSGFTTLLSFGILFLLGVLKLFDSSQPKNADKDHSQSISPKEALSLSAALSLDGCAAGFGASLSAGMTASPGAAAAGFDASAAAGFDASVTAGFDTSVAAGTASSLAPVAAVFLFSLIFGALMILTGSHIGNKAAGRLPIKPGIIGGLLLILLAVARLL